MLVKFLDKTYSIKQYSQYQGIRWAKDQNCLCGKSGMSNDKQQTVIGFCETTVGFMPIFQCDNCFEKYRYHINTTGRYKIDEFKRDIALIMFLKENSSTKKNE